MFLVSGLVLLIAGVLAAAITATLVARSVARLRSRLNKLSAHPYFEDEWRTRKAETVRELSVNIGVLNSELRALAASLGRIVIAMQAVDRVRRISAVVTEELLGKSVPWLRGLFAKKVQT